MQPVVQAPSSSEDPLVHDEIEVSVVMPCLNEARTVATCVAKAMRTLEEIGVRGEVVVADNGSTDGSQEIARSEGARVVHAERKGYGAALQAGIAASRGKYIIMGDADDSYDFTMLAPFIERLREGYELVMGNRFRGGIKPGAMPPLHQYFGNPFMTWIVNFLFHTPIGDVQCGLRGFRKDSYQRLGLITPGMEFASEMVAKASLHRQKICEVPTTLQPDGRDRRPHLRSFRDGWRNLRFLLILCPRWLYLIPAGTLMALGLFLMLWLTPGTRVVGGVSLDLHTMLLGVLCVIVGYQTVWLWAFAKIFGWQSGILPEDTFNPRTFKILNLERGLLFGAATLAFGLLINLHLVWTWWGKGLGPLDVNITLRQVFWGMTAIVIGVQTIYNSFFMSMLGMVERWGRSN